MIVDYIVYRLLISDCWLLWSLIALFSPCVLHVDKLTQKSGYSFSWHQEVHTTWKNSSPHFLTTTETQGQASFLLSSILGSTWEVFPPLFKILCQKWVVHTLLVCVWSHWFWRPVQIFWWQGGHHIPWVAITMTKHLHV